MMLMRRVPAPKNPPTVEARAISSEMVGMVISFWTMKAAMAARRRAPMARRGRIGVRPMSVASMKAMAVPGMEA